MKPLLSIVESNRMKNCWKIFQIKIKVSKFGFLCCFESEMDLMM